MARKVKQRKKEAPQYWPRVFSVVVGFCIIILSLIHSTKTMDQTMMPRLLAWTGALFLITLFFSAKSVFTQLDLSVLRRLAIPLLALYLLTGILSLFFATNISAAFYDLVKTFSSLLLLVYVSLIMLNTPDWPVRLARMFTLAATVSLIIGYYQYFSKLGFGFHPRMQIYQINMLMSHVNLYSSFVMLLIPFLVYGVVYFRKYWRLLAAFNLAATLLMVFLLQTRSVYLGTALGVMTGFIVLLVFYRHFEINPRLKNILLGAVIAGATGLVTFYILAPDDNTYVKQINSIFTDTENPRLLMWQVTATMIADRPLTGAGAGNFNVVVPRYYGDFDFGDLETNWMRPHNDFLWVASEKGILGLLVYMAFFAVIIFYAFRVVRSEAGKDKKFMALMLLTGVVAYLVFAFFDFPLERTNQQVIIMLYAAALLVLFHMHQPAKKPVRVVKRWSLLFLLVLAAIGVKYSYEALQQEKQVVLIRGYSNMDSWREMMAASQRGQTPWKTLDPYGLPVILYECLANMRANNISEALRTCEIARMHNPYRENVLTALGYIYLSNSNYPEAIDCLEVLLGIFPGHTRALTMLSVAYHETGQQDLALQTIEKIPEAERIADVVRIYEDLLGEAGGTP